MEPSSNKRSKLVNIMLLIALLVLCTNNAYASELKVENINEQQETTQEEESVELLESKESEILLTKVEIKTECLENRKVELELSKLDKSELKLSETEVIERKAAMEYTDEDLKLLSTLMYAEAGICDDAELYRVANVVINRVNNKENGFKDTIKDVIYQSGQFTSVGGEAWNRGPTEREIRIAKDVLEGARIFPENVVWFGKKHMYGKVYDTPSKWHVFSSL